MFEYLAKDLVYYRLLYRFHFVGNVITFLSFEI